MNNDLSGIQKMTYLQNLLKGSALSSISGLSLSNENYKIALDILKEHNIEIQIRSLETLKITSEMYGPLLVPIILQKIPEELKLIINRQLDKNSSWDVLTIIIILKSELRAREQVSLNLNNRSDHTSKNCTSRIKCFKCGNQHHIALCLEKQNSELQKGELTAISNICAPLNGQYINLAKEKYRHLHNLRLADSNLQNGNLEIDVFIGADYYWLFIENSIIRGNNFDPIAIKSKLGYLLSGPISFNNMFKNKNYNCCVNTAHVMFVESSSSPKSLIKESMTSVWGVKEMNECNYKVIDRFRHTIKYYNTLKRYNVNLPFKEDHPPLSDNFDLCIKRFKCLQKKLSKDDSLLKLYNDIFKEQLQNSIIERVVDKNKFEIVHYLPQQPVLRNDKVTSKVRNVFDASSSVDCPSLNDYIEKAFLQITLSLEDRDYVRFLWFENINSVNKDNIFTQKNIPYKICKVLFGVTSSSFLLSTTIISHAEKYLSDDPMIVSKLMSSLHVNDLNSGTDSIDSAINFYQKCQDQLKEGGFILRKFESNCKQLENLVNEQNFTSFNLTKVLDLVWNKKEDNLIYDYRNLTHNDDSISTKRKVL
ncbi:uncharacterized protein LOC124817160 [Hydra vulgaris]|uniref:uncharacterized protein LOC124817160 n=1 Tax=Hydra vulgaris TaxID=6087 RepID=UPI001F5F7A8D|nr:uncharacterized protein LOC124817160 [Hydra vulgaris]